MAEQNYHRFAVFNNAVTYPACPPMKDRKWVNTNDKGGCRNLVDLKAKCKCGKNSSLLNQEIIHHIFQPLLTVQQDAEATVQMASIVKVSPHTSLPIGKVNTSGEDLKTPMSQSKPKPKNTNSGSFGKRGQTGRNDSDEWITSFWDKAYRLM